MIQTYIQLRLRFRTIKDLGVCEPQHVQELRNDISTWNNVASSLSSQSGSKTIVHEILEKKINSLQENLKEKLLTDSIPDEIFKETLQNLQQKVCIFYKFFKYSKFPISILLSKIVFH